MKKFMLGGILILSVSACTYKRPPVKTGLEGQPMPAFSLMLPDSLSYYSSRNVPEGKPVVLFFFSPDCPFCRAQMREMVRKMESLQDVNVLLVTNWPFAEMKYFYSRYELYRFNNVITGFDYSNSLNFYMKIPYVPFTAIYDGNKRLKQAFIGKISVRQIQDVAFE